MADDRRLEEDHRQAKATGFAAQPSPESDRIALTTVDGDAELILHWPEGSQTRSIHVTLIATPPPGLVIRAVVFEGEPEPLRVRVFLLALDGGYNLVQQGEPFTPLGTSIPVSEGRVTHIGDQVTCSLEIAPKGTIQGVMRAFLIVDEPAAEELDATAEPLPPAKAPTDRELLAWLHAIAIEKRSAQAHRRRVLDGLAQSLRAELKHRRAHA